MIPFCDLTAVNRMASAEIGAAIDRVCARGQYVLGDEVEAFESEWATYCGYRNAVGVGNGFDALRLMLQAYGIGPGDDVIVPTNTYIATWLAVSAVGANLIPVEPDPRTGLIDPIQVDLAMSTRRVRAVLAVHLYGRRCDMTALRRSCGQHGALLLVDAAQAHGLRELGDAAAFSFYPTKNLGALGDAGAVVTNDDRVAGLIRQLRNYGCESKDVHAVRGVNSRLDELQAAILRAKLPFLDRWNLTRQSNGHRYDSMLGGRAESLSVEHIHVFRTDQRDRLRADLASAGIGTMIHYPTPPHLQQAYAGMGWRVGSFPIAERLARESVSLPVGPELSFDDVYVVCQEVARSLRVAA